MSDENSAISNSCDIQPMEDPQKHDFKNLFTVIFCLLFSLLTTYLTNNPYVNYLPIMFIGTIEWYRSYPRQKRSYYGLYRLLLFMLIITLWIVFLLKFLIQNIASLFGYHDLPIQKIQHLFPHALLIACYARTKHDMDLNDKRRYIIHLLYDLPAFLLVIIFKFFNHPLNSLYSQITDHCYLGCLPLASDVEILNNIGIKYVVNLCAEYNGPCKTYEKYNIKQLHVPTIDITAPSFDTIRKAIQFMNEALKENQKIFVHCKVGMGRSATIVFCHLVANEKMTPEDAITLLKEKRPEVLTSLINYAPVKQFLLSLKTNKT